MIWCPTVLHPGIAPRVAGSLARKDRLAQNRRYVAGYRRPASANDRWTGSRDGQRWAGPPPVRAVSFFCCKISSLVFRAATSSASRAAWALLVVAWISASFAAICRLSAASVCCPDGDAESGGRGGVEEIEETMDENPMTRMAGIVACQSRETAEGWSTPGGGGAGRPGVSECVAKVAASKSFAGFSCENAPRG